jgi:hypothetical protein
MHNLTHSTAPTAPTPLTSFSNAAAPGASGDCLTLSLFDTLPTTASFSKHCINFIVHTLQPPNLPVALLCSEGGNHEFCLLLQQTAAVLQQCQCSVILLYPAASTRILAEYSPRCQIKPSTRRHSAVMKACSRQPDAFRADKVFFLVFQAGFFDIFAGKRAAPLSFPNNPRGMFTSVGAFGTKLGALSPSRELSARIFWVSVPASGFFMY